MQRAIEWLQAHGVGLYVAFLQSYFAEGALAAGDLALAREYGHALERARFGHRLGEASAHRTLAQAHALSGAIAGDVMRKVSRAFGAAAFRGSEREAALTNPLAAELQVTWGQSELARAVAEQAHAALIRMQMDWSAARARRLLLTLSA
jgi:hypothetical protein